LYAIVQLVGWSLLAIGAGASFVMQSAVNANLRATLGSPSWVAFVSYAGGTLTMLVVLLALREKWPTATSLQQSSFLSWTGGIFGAVYVVILIVLLPRLGAATVIAALVAGQMLTSVIFDHFGLFGLPRHPADLSRGIGALLLIAGVGLMRS
jgi:transporter family-2 protein